MDYVRQTMGSAELSGIIDLPPTLRNRMVQVIILPAEEIVVPSPKTGSAFGCLKKYANPELIPQEKGAWERAVVEKYAGS